MKFEYAARPGSTAVKVTLDPGEALVAEGGSMISMSSNLSLSTSTMRKEKGSGMMGVLKRMIAGENLFLNLYQAPSNKGGEIWLAPTLPGDLEVVQINAGETLTVESGAWLAGEEDLDLNLSWQGFGNALVGGEGVFWLKITGQGQAVLSAYGAIKAIEIDGEYIVDTGHIVAFTQGLSFQTEVIGGHILGAIASSEGFVARFRGRGTLWVQSHSPNSFGVDFGAMLKPR